LPKYSHIEGGKCFSCNGTGGKHPPEGVYQVLIHHKATYHDLMDGCGGDWDTHLGWIKKLGRKWQGKDGQVFRTRNEAAESLRAP
jgi:hypothetical protein